MTEQMAVYCLKAESERYPQVCEECPLYGETGCDHCYDDANDVAIKALEKQIPKQVKLYIGQDMQCPVCEKRLRAYEGLKICYCKFCGQALER